MTERKFETEAAQFIQAIKTIAVKPDNIDNLECYLSIHFDSWLKRYANTPEGLVSEIKEFAEMGI